MRNKKQEQEGAASHARHIEPGTPPLPPLRAEWGADKQYLMISVIHVLVRLDWPNKT